jgi:hypothetical protein
MSYVEVLGVEVLNNPAKFTDQLGFKITFKCNVKTQEGEKPIFTAFLRIFFLCRCSHTS